MILISELYLTNMLDLIFLELAYGNYNPRVAISLHTRTHYSDSEATSICSYSLMLRA